MSSPTSPRTPGRDPNRRPHITDALRDAALRSDWRPFRGLYRQYNDLASQASDDTRLWGLRALQAEALANMECAYNTAPSDLAVHVWAQLADVGNYERLDATSFEELYREKRLPSIMVDDRRRPSLFEAAVETCRRWRDNAAIAAALTGTGSSGIQCGSVNYGPFYCVRGNGGTDWASDLDIVIITTGDTDLADIGKRLGTVPGISAEDVAEFNSRVPVFVHRLDDGRTVLSHKFRFWGPSHTDPLLFDSNIPGHYLLSIHIIPPEVLTYALVESSTDLTADMNGGQRPIRDYRNRPSERPDQLHSFDGRRFRLLPDSRHVDGGTLRRTSAYYIDTADRYYPGLYQIITQPSVNLRWDDATVRPRFDKLRFKLAERLRYEQQRDVYTDLRPSNAHLRLSMLAPHVIQLLDGKYSPN